MLLIQDCQDFVVLGLGAITASLFKMKYLKQNLDGCQHKDSISVLKLLSQTFRNILFPLLFPRKLLLSARDNETEILVFKCQVVGVQNQVTAQGPMAPPLFCFWFGTTSKGVGQCISVVTVGQ